MITPVLRMRRAFPSSRTVPRRGLGRHVRRWLRRGDGAPLGAQLGQDLAGERLRPGARPPPASRTRGSRSRRRCHFAACLRAVSRSSRDNDPARMIVGRVAARFAWRARRRACSPRATSSACPRRATRRRTEPTSGSVRRGPVPPIQIGGCGRCTGSGRMLASCSETCRPSYDTTSPVNSRVTISSVSCSRSKRSPSTGTGCRARGAPPRTTPRRGRARAGRATHGRW